MRKTLLYLFMLMEVAAMPLTSCNKVLQEEEGKHDPYSDKDQKPITSYDGLSWLQGSLVVVDKNGDVFKRIYGKALDESQPDVISVPVADYAGAERTFLRWVAPGKTATKVDGGYDYALTDEDGKAQGSVSLRAVDGEAGMVALMSVAPGTDLKQISEVRFIDSDFWPENADFSKVEAGKIYEIEDYYLSWTDKGLYYQFNKPVKKELPFYCIQGNTDGNEGILIWLSPDADDDQLHPETNDYYISARPYLATESEAEMVRDFYNNPENRTFWENMLKEMDAKGYEWSAQDLPNSTNNAEFMINKVGNAWGNHMYCLDLDLDEEGEIDWTTLFSNFHYRYIHIEIVPPFFE